MKYLTDIRTWFLIGGLILIIFWYFKNKQPASVVIDTNFKPVTEYQDKEGKDHQVVPNQEVSPQVMRSLIDSIAASLKGKNVQVITQVIQKTDTVFRESVTMDSNCNFEVNKVDPYLTIKVKGNKDFADITLQTIDTITFALTKTKHLFKADVTQIDINNTNPYNKVKEGRSYSIRTPKTLVSIGPYVGYDFINMRPAAGIAVTFPIFNIKSK